MPKTPARNDPPTPGPVPPEAPTVGTRGSLAAGPGERPGDQIGPYHLISPLGEGGFGVVWLAERREPYQQRVALKVIKPGMDSAQVIARFEQERQALALMSHPNVAKVLDGGISPSGRPYFVMEYVKGEPITAYCDRHRLTIRERLTLFLQVCDAVQHAHTKGIIHRDIKPTNVLVVAGATEEGGNAKAAPTVRVIDFGVAKAVRGGLTEKTIFTETGQLIGTPEYMSPEQADVGNTDIDTRTDVYAMGVLLYEMLAGTLPFEPRELRSKGYREIQRIIREVDPPTPSRILEGLRTSAAERDAARERPSAEAIAGQRRIGLAELVRTLHRELEWIPMLAMRKNRDERYGSPGALAEDIRAYLAGRPLKAGPPSAWYRARKFIRRHAGGVSVAATAVLLLTVFGIVSSVLYAEKAAAERASRRSEGEARRAEAASSRARDEARDAAESAARAAYAANIAAAGALLELGNSTDARKRLDLCPPERREWEWRVLRHAGDSSAASAPMGGDLRFVRFSEDGSKIVALTSMAVSVWRGDLSGQISRTRLSEGMRPRFLPLCTDGSGSTVIAAEDAPTAQGQPLWAWQNGTWRTLGLHTGMTHPGARLDGGGNLLLLSTQDAEGNVRPMLADLSKPGETRAVEAQSAAWLELGQGKQGLLLQRGEEVLTADTAGEPNGKFDVRLPALPAASGREVVASPVATGGIVASLRSQVLTMGWQRGSQEPALTLSRNTEHFAAAAGALAWAEGSTIRYLAAPTGPGVAPLADAQSRALRLRGGNGRVIGLALAPDGRTVVGVDDTGVARVWMPDTAERAAATVGSSALRGVVRTHAYGAVLLSRTGTQGRYAALWPDATLGLRLEGDGAALGLSADGDRLAVRTTGANGDALTLWRRRGDTYEPSGPPFASGLAFRIGGEDAVCWLEEGAGVLVYCESNQKTKDNFGLWHVSMEGVATHLHAPQAAQRAALTVSRDGRVFALGLSKKVLIWLDGPANPAREVEVAGGVSSLAFDATGQRLAAGMLDGSLTLIAEFVRPVTRRSVGSHRGPVRALAFTPDGKRVVSGGDDATLQVWSTEGEQILILPAEGPVGTIAFPGGGETAVMTLRSGAIRILRAAGTARPESPGG